MNPKTVIGFAVVTLIVLIAAGASIGARISGAPATTGKERLFPALTEKAAEVAEISVQTAAETLTVKRRGEGWVLAERQGFAVAEDVVRKLIVGLSELRLAEAKTARSKLYARLEVEDVTAKEAKSKLIRLKDKSGEVMAELIIGKENAALAGPTGVGLYVRKPGEERAWLVQGAVQVPLEAKNWVAPEIINVTKQRVTRVSVVQPDGITMVINKPRPGGGDFEIKDLGDAVVKYDSDVQNVGEGLDALELEDVRARSELEFTDGKVVKTEFLTFAGLKVDAELFEAGDGKFWARFKASVTDGADATKKADLAKEAAEINAKVGDWVYRIPAHKYRYMTRTLKDVLEEEKKDGN